MEEKELYGYEESASEAVTEASENNTDEIPAKKRIASEIIDWFDTVVTSIVAIIVVFALITKLL